MGFFSNAGGSVTSGAFGLLGQGIQALFNKGAEKRAEQRQIDAEKRQNEYNIAAEKRAIGYQKDMIRFENEYNSPTAQMKRLSDAGLNPYLQDVNAVASSNGSGSIGAEAPTATASETIAGDYGTQIGDILSNSVNDIYSRNLDAQRMRVEMLKLEQTERDLVHKMNLEDRQFAYQQEVNRINQDFEQKRLLLNERQLDQNDKQIAYKKIEDDRRFSLDEAKQKYEVANIEANTKYVQDKNKREFQIHNIDIKDKTLRNKLLQLDFDFENEAATKAFRRSVRDIDLKLKKYDEKEKDYLTNLLEKKFTLDSKRLDNLISDEEYKSNQKAIFDAYTRGDYGIIGRALFGDGSMFKCIEMFLGWNPYTGEDGGIGSALSILSKFLK